MPDLLDLKESITQRIVEKLELDNLSCKSLLELAQAVSELERTEFMKSMYGSLAGGKLETCCCEKENSNGE